MGKWIGYESFVGIRFVSAVVGPLWHVAIECWVWCFFYDAIFHFAHVHYVFIQNAILSGIAFPPLFVQTRQLSTNRSAFASTHRPLKSKWPKQSSNHRGLMPLPHNQLGIPTWSFFKPIQFHSNKLSLSYGFPYQRLSFILPYFLYTIDSPAYLPPICPVLQSYCGKKYSCHHLINNSSLKTYEIYDSLSFLQFQCFIVCGNARHSISSPPSLPKIDIFQKNSVKDGLISGLRECIPQLFILPGWFTVRSSFQIQLTVGCVSVRFKPT